MTDEKHPDPMTWWFHRRWQAWAGVGLIAVAWAVGAAGAWIVAPESAAILTAHCDTAMWLGAAVTTLYHGACGIEALSKLRWR